MQRAVDSLTAALSSVERSQAFLAAQAPIGPPPTGIESWRRRAKSKTVRTTNSTGLPPRPISSKDASIISEKPITTHSENRRLSAPELETPSMTTTPSTPNREEEGVTQLIQGVTAQLEAQLEEEERQEAEKLSLQDALQCAQAEVIVAVRGVTEKLRDIDSSTIDTSIATKTNSDSGITDGFVCSQIARAATLLPLEYYNRQFNIRRVHDLLLDSNDSLEASQKSFQNTVFQLLDFDPSIKEPEEIVKNISEGVVSTDGIADSNNEEAEVNVWMESFVSQLDGVLSAILTSGMGGSKIRPGEENEFIGSFLERCRVIKKKNLDKLRQSMIFARRKVAAEVRELRQAVIDCETQLKALESHYESTDAALRDAATNERAVREIVESRYSGTVASLSDHILRQSYQLAEVSEAANRRGKQRLAVANLCEELTLKRQRTDAFSRRRAMALVAGRMEVVGESDLVIQTEREIKVKALFRELVDYKQDFCDQERRQGMLNRQLESVEAELVSVVERLPIEKASLKEKSANLRATEQSLLERRLNLERILSMYAKRDRDRQKEANRAKYAAGDQAEGGIEKYLTDEQFIDSTFRKLKVQRTKTAGAGLATPIVASGGSLLKRKTMGDSDSDSDSFNTSESDDDVFNAQDPTGFSVGNGERRSVSPKKVASASSPTGSGGGIGGAVSMRLVVDGTTESLLTLGTNEAARTEMIGSTVAPTMIMTPAMQNILVTPQEAERTRELLGPSAISSVVVTSTVPQKRGGVVVGRQTASKTGLKEEKQIPDEDNEGLMSVFIEQGNLPPNVDTVAKSNTMIQRKKDRHTEKECNQENLLLRPVASTVAMAAYSQLLIQATDHRSTASIAASINLSRKANRKGTNVGAIKATSSKRKRRLAVADINFAPTRGDRFDFDVNEALKVLRLAIERLSNLGGFDFTLTQELYAVLNDFERFQSSGNQAFTNAANDSKSMDHSVVETGNLFSLHRIVCRVISAAFENSPRALVASNHRSALASVLCSILATIGIVLNVTISWWDPSNFVTGSAVWLDELSSDIVNAILGYGRPAETYKPSNDAFDFVQKRGTTNVSKLSMQQISEAGTCEDWSVETLKGISPDELIRRLVKAIWNVIPPDRLNPNTATGISLILNELLLLFPALTSEIPDHFPIDLSTIASTKPISTEKSTTTPFELTHYTALRLFQIVLLLCSHRRIISPTEVAQWVGQCRSDTAALASNNVQSSYVPSQTFTSPDDLDGTLLSLRYPSALPALYTLELFIRVVATDISRRLFLERIDAGGAGNPDTMALLHLNLTAPTAMLVDLQRSAEAAAAAGSVVHKRQIDQQSRIAKRKKHMKKKRQMDAAASKLAAEAISNPEVDGSDYEEELDEGDDVFSEENSLSSPPSIENMSLYNGQDVVAAIRAQRLSALIPREGPQAARGSFLSKALQPPVPRMSAPGKGLAPQAAISDSLVLASRKHLFIDNLPRRSVHLKRRLQNRNPKTNSGYRPPYKLDPSCDVPVFLNTQSEENSDEQSLEWGDSDSEPDVSVAAKTIRLRVSQSYELPSAHEAWLSQLDAHIHLLARDISRLAYAGPSTNGISAQLSIRANNPSTNTRAGLPEATIHAILNYVASLLYVVSPRNADATTELRKRFQEFVTLVNDVRATQRRVIERTNAVTRPLRQRRAWLIDRVSQINSENQRLALQIDSFQGRRDKAAADLRDLKHSLLLVTTEKAQFRNNTTTVSSEGAGNKGSTERGRVAQVPFDDPKAGLMLDLTAHSFEIQRLLTEHAAEEQRLRLRALRTEEATLSENIASLSAIFAEMAAEGAGLSRATNAIAAAASSSTSSQSNTAARIAELLASTSSKPASQSSKLTPAADTAAALSTMQSATAGIIATLKAADGATDGDASQAVKLVAADSELAVRLREILQRGPAARAAAFKSLQETASENESLREAFTRATALLADDTAISQQAYEDLRTAIISSSKAGSDIGTVPLPEGHSPSTPRHLTTSLAQMGGFGVDLESKLGNRSEATSRSVSAVPSMLEFSPQISPRMISPSAENFSGKATSYFADDDSDSDEGHSQVRSVSGILDPDVITTKRIASALESYLSPATIANTLSEKFIDESQSSSPNHWSSGPPDVDDVSATSKRLRKAAVAERRALLDSYLDAMSPSTAAAVRAQLSTMATAPAYQRATAAYETALLYHLANRSNVNNSVNWRPRVTGAGLPGTRGDGKTRLTGPQQRALLQAQLVSLAREFNKGIVNTPQSSTSGKSRINLPNPQSSDFHMSRESMEVMTTLLSGLGGDLFLPPVFLNSDLKRPWGVFPKLTGSWLSLNGKTLGGTTVEPLKRDILPSRTGIISNIVSSMVSVDGIAVLDPRVVLEEPPPPDNTDTKSADTKNSVNGAWAPPPSDTEGQLLRTQLPVTTPSMLRDILRLHREQRRAAELASEVVNTVLSPAEAQSASSETKGIVHEGNINTGDNLQPSSLRLGSSPPMSAHPSVGTPHISAPRPAAIVPRTNRTFAIALPAPDSDHHFEHLDGESLALSDFGDDNTLNNQLTNNQDSSTIERKVKKSTKTAIARTIPPNGSFSSAFPLHLMPLPGQTSFPSLSYTDSIPTLVDEAHLSEEEDIEPGITTDAIVDSYADTSGRLVEEELRKFGAALSRDLDRIAVATLETGQIPPSTPFWRQMQIRFAKAIAKKVRKQETKVVASLPNNDQNPSRFDVALRWLVDNSVDGAAFAETLSSRQASTFSARGIASLREGTPEEQPLWTAVPLNDDVQTDVTRTLAKFTDALSLELPTSLKSLDPKLIDSKSIIPNDDNADLSPNFIKSCPIQEHGSKPISAPETNSSIALNDSRLSSLIARDQAKRFGSHLRVPPRVPKSSQILASPRRAVHKPLGTLLKPDN